MNVELHRACVYFLCGSYLTFKKYMVQNSFLNPEINYKKNKIKHVFLNQDIRLKLGLTEAHSNMQGFIEVSI